MKRTDTVLDLYKVNEDLPPFIVEEIKEISDTEEKGTLREDENKPTSMETVEGIEMQPNKESAISSLNESKDKRCFDIDRKIQLSANRLSSKKCSSSVKDYYGGEDISNKQCTPKEVVEYSTESLNLDESKKEDSYTKKCIFTDSSSRTLSSNKQQVNVFASFSNNE